MYGDLSLVGVVIGVHNNNREEENDDEEDIDTNKIETTAQTSVSTERTV